MFTSIHHKMTWQAARKTLVAVLVAALLQSSGHIFVHLSDAQLAAQAVTQCEPLQHDAPANQAAGNTNHSCAGCESLQKIRDVLPVSFAFTPTPFVAFASDRQRLAPLAAPVLASSPSRAPPQA
jgi:hypothetical protein